MPRCFFLLGMGIVRYVSYFLFRQPKTIARKAQHPKHKQANDSIMTIRVAAIGVVAAIVAAIMMGPNAFLGGGDVGIDGNSKPKFLYPRGWYDMRYAPLLFPLGYGYRTICIVLLISPTKDNSKESTAPKAQAGKRFNHDNQSGSNWSGSRHRSSNNDGTECLPWRR